MQPKGDLKDQEILEQVREDRSTCCFPRSSALSRDLHSCGTSIDQLWAIHGPTEQHVLFKTTKVFVGFLTFCSQSLEALDESKFFRVTLDKRFYLLLQQTFVKYLKCYLNSSTEVFSMARQHFLTKPHTK